MTAEAIVLDWVGWWRVFNIFATGWAVLLMVRYAISCWHRWDPRLRLLNLAFTGLILNEAVHAIENLVQNNPYGFRIAVATVLLFWVIVPLMISEESPRELRGRADR